MISGAAQTAVVYLSLEPSFCYVIVMMYLLLLQYLGPRVIVNDGHTCVIIPATK